MKLRTIGSLCGSTLVLGAGTMFVVPSTGCSESSPSAGRDADAEAAVFGDAGWVPAADSGYEAGTDAERLPGTCELPDGSAIHCDFGLACAMTYALDGGTPDEVDASASAENLMECVGDDVAGSVPCGGFTCGPGCTCRDPGTQRCLCQ